MRRFRWRLERVLEIRRKQEDGLREKLFRLSVEVVRMRQGIFELEATLRDGFSELAGGEGKLRDREIYLAAAQRMERRLKEMRGSLREIEGRRREAIGGFEKASRSVKTLERLRAEAAGRHNAAMTKLEQGALDEGAHFRAGQALSSEAQSGS